MNREEILARSRSENQGRLDERSEHQRIRAGSFSQGIGMILCVVMGFIGFVITRTADFLWCGLSIYWGMLAAERIRAAIDDPSRPNRVVAVAVACFALLAAALYVCCLLDVF